MNGIEKRELLWWQKCRLTLNEASEYFEIIFGVINKRLRQYGQVSMNNG